MHKLDHTKPHKGLYLGETGRTLFERVNEHIALYRNHDFSSFMFKHWALNHPESVSAPKFVFKVVKKHKDVLSRMVHEAILIGKHASMNSKSEWRGFQVKRLTIEKTDWQTKKELDQGEARAKAYECVKGEGSICKI